MEETRKSAEEFLELIKRSRRGKFKIYIGMSAGVGKTYRMLARSEGLIAQWN
jgi:two-component system sensor histidine kinase KdpD